MVDLNAAERKALLLATVLVALGASARLGLGPGPVAWAWSPAGEGEERGAAADVRAAVGRELERARRAARPLAPDERLDPNRAPAAELERLPGVGPATARSIVASRVGGRVFRWREDMLAVRGIGPATLARIGPHLALAAAPPGVARTVADGRSSARPRPGGGRIDVSRASARELEVLPGVGPAIARRIVEWRERRGAIRSVEELLEVRGIGPARLEELRTRVTVGRPRR